MVMRKVIITVVSFIFSSILGYYLIPVLKKFKLSQSLNKYLERSHRSKKGTPTMGGIIFIVPSILLTLILCSLGKMNLTKNLVIIMFTFISYALIGFIDDMLIIIKRNNKGLSKSQKFVMQVIVAIVFFYLFMSFDNEPLIWIHTLNIKQNIGWLYGIFILFVLTASSNAVNLTDGLDGLAGGLSVICFITFGIITYNTEWLKGYEDISTFAFILTGCILGFLLFNKPKAKVFMGDTGSLALGATLGAFGIMTRREILLVLIGIVFVIETVSTILQVIIYKLTHRRLFPMTPIHHSFEMKGWKEKNIVILFWTIGLLASIIAIIWGVIL